MHGKTSIFFLIILYFTIFQDASAQSTKKVKQNEVKSKTEWKYVHEKGKVFSYKTGYTAYDQQGNVIEEVTYDADGAIKKRETYAYDPNGNKTEEIRYDLKGNITGKIVFKYDESGIRTERIEYDANGNILEREKRVFEYYK